MGREVTSEPAGARAFSNRPFQLQLTTAIDYTHAGGFDRTKFATAFESRKYKHPYFRVRFSAAAVVNAWTLIQMMQADVRVTDMRWMAYMLATAFWEAAHTVNETVQVPKLGKGKKPVLGPDGKPVMLDKQIKVWEVMVPIDEIAPSNSRRYKAPVKVKLIEAADVELLKAMSRNLLAANVLGGAWIVEKDGDQFVVDATGTTTWQSKKSEMGATFGAAATKTYLNFHGDERAYFGRGYVQLTWWSNYVAAGVALRRGLDLLFDPLLVKNPQVAYDIMAHGMITGEGFANRHTLQKYIFGDKKDYLNARRMVNGGDVGSYQPIAEIAELFEEMLLESKA